MKIKTIIGLETHVQLLTKTKIFSNSLNKFSKKPNIYINEYDIGLPGALPVLNKKVINLAIKFGIAVNAFINNISYFDRKNYFYPDLSKGYQITQSNIPILKGGKIEFFSSQDKKNKIINLISAHLEEDCGKLFHKKNDNKSLIDFNRSGIPLLEIITKPEIYNVSDVIDYIKKLRILLIWLKICDGNMENGSFRCDVNVSLKIKNSNILNNRCEIKNLNSFKHIKNAINYEIKRQKKIIKKNKIVLQETFLYNVNKKKTIFMRKKEFYKDYRYFLDPDLLPLYISNKKIKKIRKNMPKCLNNIINIYYNIYHISYEYIYLLLKNKKIFKYFEKVLFYLKKKYLKLILNWIINEYNFFINQNKKKKNYLNALNFSYFLKYIIKKNISNKNSKNIFNIIKIYIFNNNFIDLNIIIKIIKDNIFIKKINFLKLNKIIKKIIFEENKIITNYKLGNKKILNSLIGKIIKITKNKVHPIEIKKIIDININK